MDCSPLHSPTCHVSPDLWAAMLSSMWPWSTLRLPPEVALVTRTADSETCIVRSTISCAAVTSLSLFSSDGHLTSLSSSIHWTSCFPPNFQPAGFHEPTCLPTQEALPTSQSRHPAGSRAAVSSCYDSACLPQSLLVHCAHGYHPCGALHHCDVLLLQTVMYDLEMTVTFIHSVLDAILCLDRFHYLGQEIFPSLL